MLGTSKKFCCTSQGMMHVKEAVEVVSTLVNSAKLHRPVTALFTRRYCQSATRPFSGRASNWQHEPRLSKLRSELPSRLHAFPRAPPSRVLSSTAADSRPHHAFIALGSNIGDRLKYIEDACLALGSETDVKILRTSGLWETKAMYVTDQADFLNGVCEIETRLQPMELLARLQSIEKQLRRRKLIEKGPRTIDLDILLYDDVTMDTERLKIPHPLMLERAFVLQPLCQLIPDRMHVHELSTSSGPRDTLTPTYREALESIDQQSLAGSTITPLRQDEPFITALDKERQTKIMSVLNVTPDSFSDGGLHLREDTKSLTEVIQQHLDDGADIIDVGGQSTRPNAAEVSAEEEKRRVIPVIQLIRSILDTQETSKTAAISIDTFRADVARAAIEAGADIVNDVSGGDMDENMYSTVASLGCTYMLMHMRGNPATMANKANTSYPNGLTATILNELNEKVSRAMAAGVRAWRIILDPGVGFAKTGPQNLELLQKLHEMRMPYEEGYPTTCQLYGMPWAVGTSRKRFIGQVTGVSEARERVWGTAACVTAAVQGGADVVRVHDVREMKQVATMADAIWRRR